MPSVKTISAITKDSCLIPISQLRTIAGLLDCRLCLPIRASIVRYIAFMCVLLLDTINIFNVWHGLSGVRI